jgi:hypothetical protein
VKSHEARVHERRWGANVNVMRDRLKQAEAMFSALTASERLALIRTVPKSEQRLIVDGLCENKTESREVSEAVSRAWGKEIASRIDDIDSGRVKLIPVAEVIAEARERLRRAQ